MIGVCSKIGLQVTNVELELTAILTALTRMITDYEHSTERVFKIRSQMETVILMVENGF